MQLVVNIPDCIHVGIWFLAGRETFHPIRLDPIGLNFGLHRGIHLRLRLGLVTPDRSGGAVGQFCLPLLVIFEDCPVDGPLVSEIGRVTDQTFPLLVILHHLEILPAEVPADALATEGVGTEVTEVDLTPLRAPPATPIISCQSHGRDLQS